LPCARAKSGTKDPLCTNGDVWTIKEVLEKAAKADRRAVSEAIRQINTTKGPAQFFPGGRVKFLDKGTGDGAVFVIAPWQNGEPITVYPPASAPKDPVRPKRMG
jgi:branched-chain amino acid transport system substrate-binding protein